MCRAEERIGQVGNWALCSLRDAVVRAGEEMSALSLLAGVFLERLFSSWLMSGCCFIEEMRSTKKQAF